MIITTRVITPASKLLKNGLKPRRLSLTLEKMNNLGTCRLKMISNLLRHHNKTAKIKLTIAFNNGLQNLRGASKPDLLVKNIPYIITIGNKHGIIQTKTLGSTLFNNNLIPHNNIIFLSSFVKYMYPSRYKTVNKLHLYDKQENPD